ncbi:related to thermostable alkaline protease precursor [Fusarium fujikuroi]|nr:related to thermostable alkaline protease precursor [Fusarium fujikuroi]
MSLERVNPFSELFLWVTRLIPGELPLADSIRPEEISNDEQNDRDFYVFESEISAISGAYENINLKSEDSDTKFCKTLEAQLRTFGDRLPNPDKSHEHHLSSTNNNYNDPIDKIHRYSDSVLTTGSFDPKIAHELLPKSRTQWRDGVNGLTELNKMAENKAYSQGLKLSQRNPKKPLTRPIDTECIDLPLEHLFDHLVNRTCRNRDHAAFLKLSGWKEIQYKSVFHTLLSTCNTVEGHETSQCYTTCTLESPDSQTQEEDLSICKVMENAQLKRIPLWLSFNSAGIWLADTKGLEIISLAKRENRRQITLKQLMQEKNLKSSDGYMARKKFQLAYRLVSSLRHLYLGSWLQQDLTTKNIFIICDSKSHSDDTMHEPYINCLLQSSLKRKNAVIEDFALGNQDFSRFFLSLAQVLLDIFKGETEELDYGSNLKAWYDALADEVEVILKDDAIKDYRTALHSCLLFFDHYHSQMAKAQKMELRAQWVILEHIVVPLRNNLDTWERQVSQLSKEPTHCETCHQPYHRDSAHKATNHRPTSATFTLFSDEDDSNEVLKPNRLQARSEHDFSTRMEKFVQRHILQMVHVNISTIHPHKRVTVAIIDTGFNANDDPFFVNAERRILKRRSFIGKEGDWEDMHGHGTHVARLVLRHAPECEVYVAKISNTRSFSEDQVGQLAKALEWAGEHADIINLSFGLGQRCPSPRLKEVLSKLVLDRKLIFAAASNSGGNRSRPWPANHPGVFCIHATDERAVTNLKMNPTPLYGDDNFATLGENIESYWNGEMRCISGTSFATPIAAAMTANILEFARRNLSADEAHNLQAYGPMRTLFRHKMTDNGKAKGSYHYIKPWSNQLWGENGSNEDVAGVFREFLVHWA